MASLRPFSILACCLLLTLGAACASESSDPELQLCEPLGTTSASLVELEELVGAGRDAEGTIYVVDKTRRGDVRAFVGDESGLRSEVVGGAGGGTQEGGEWTTVTLDGLNLMIKVTTAADGTRRMGVCEASDDARDFTIGEEGEELEVLEPAAVETLPITDLPGDVFVEYWVQTEDGQLLLVTRPTYDWDYTDFRVFFGPPDRVDERIVDEVQRLRDGGTTMITFDIDGTQATATFPTPSGDDEPWMELGGETFALTEVTADPHEGADFYCR